MRLWIALTAVLTSAVLYGLAFPSAGLKPLAWVCLVPFLLALRSVGRWEALLLGALLAQLGSSIVADALPSAVSTYYLQPAWVGWAFAIGTWAITGSVYYVAFAPVYRALGRRTTLALPLLTGAAWAVMELARGRLFTGSSFFVGNPWALIGYSQVGWDPIVQIASLAGIYGVGFVVVAVNAGITEIVWALWRDPPALPRAAAGLGLAAAATLGAFVFGLAELRRADAWMQATTPVPVVVVQADLDLGSQWRSDFYGRNLDEYLELTREALGPTPAQIVFWPESALTFFVEDETSLRVQIRYLLRENGVELVVGGPHSTDDYPPRYHNSVFLLDDSPGVRGRYDKQYLVPFTEFFPLRGLDFVRRRFERVRVFEHGGPAELLPTRAGPAGILICNEGMLPEVAGKRARAGAAFLVNPSNDSWIARDKWARMMFDLVSVRAIEQRRFLVRASTSGPSAIVDPWGRASVRSQPFSRAVVRGDIRPSRELSLYGRVGDLFVLLCGISVLGAIVIRRPTRAAAALQDRVGS